MPEEENKTELKKSIEDIRKEVDSQSCYRKIFHKRVSKWKDIAQDIGRRHELLFASIAGLKSQDEFRFSDNKGCLKIAATDIFVEKAQRLLTSRARWCLSGDIVTSLLFLIILTVSTLYIVNFNIFDTLQESPPLTGMILSRR